MESEDGVPVSDHEGYGERPLAYSIRQLLILLVTIISAYAIMAKPIYRYGVSDQANQLVLIKHVMDPAYLVNDWVVGVRTEFISPRYYYIRSVGEIAEVVGLPTAVFALYLLSTLASLAGIWLLVDELFADRLVATVTVGLFLAHSVNVPGGVPYPPDLGGNSLIANYLIPSHLANAFIVGGLVYAARARYRLSFVLLGVATLFHVVNGLWMTLTVGCCVIAVETWSELKHGDSRGLLEKMPWGGLLMYGVIASITIVPLFLDNLTADVGFEAAFITAWLRHPHHYVPSSWPILETATTVVFVLGVTLSMVRYRHLLVPERRKRRFVFTYVFALIAIMFSGGFVFTEIIPVGTAIKLQAFHIDDFLYVMLYGGASKLLVLGLFRVSTATSIKPTTFSVVVFVVVIVASVSLWGSIYGLNLGAGAGYVSTASPSDDLERSYAWIESKTPEDAVFLVSPAREGFRFHTSRARVVNFKSYPFKPNGMIEWKQRMDAVCNADIRDFPEGGFPIAHECERRFHGMSEEEIREIADEYGANWILTKHSEYDFQREFSAGGYHVYKIGNSTDRTSMDSAARSVARGQIDR